MVFVHVGHVVLVHIHVHVVHVHVVHVHVVPVHVHVVSNHSEVVYASTQASKPASASPITPNPFPVVASHVIRSKTPTKTNLKSYWSRLIGVSWDLATRTVIWIVFGVAVAAVACERSERVPNHT